MKGGVDGRKCRRRYWKMVSLRGGITLGALSWAIPLCNADRCRQKVRKQKVREEWAEAREILHSIREA